MIVLVFAAITVFTVSAYEPLDEKRLHDDLFLNYSALTRPRRNHSTTVVIEVDMHLRSVEELSESTQKLSTLGWLDLEWTDDLLQWNPNEYSGCDLIHVPANNIWKPDITLDNGVNTFQITSAADVLLQVRYDGRVEWSPASLLETHCQLDVTFYPFDIQECSIRLALWTYSSERVLLHSLFDHIELEYYSPSDKWDLVHTHARDWLHPNEFLGYTSHMAFNVTLRRKPLFFVLNTIFPALTLGFLNPVIFLLPPETGERMSVSLTLLLSMAIVHATINSSLPQTSSSTSILSVCLIFLIICSAISVLLSVMVLRIHHGRFNRKELFCGLFTAEMCKKKKKKKSETTRDVHHNDVTVEAKGEKPTVGPETHDIGSDPASVFRRQSETHVTCRVDGDQSRERLNSVPVTNGNSNERSSLKDGTVDCEILARRQQFTVKLDRFLFWLYIVCTIISPLVLIVLLVVMAPSA